MNVKGVDIGSGQPKVVVSFSNHSKETVDEEIQGVLDNPSAVDVIEVRSDAFDALSHEAHLALVNHIIESLKDYPILYTYRTQSEGGKGQKTAVEYESLLNSVLDECDIQLIDVEFFMYEDIVDALIEKAKRKGVLVVLSQHDFRDTPDFDEIMATYKDMNERGGDILKLAYNPADGRDVLSILTAVHDARQQLKCQVVGISMGELGKITRVAGGVFGSCLTYGYISHKAAPGQFHVQDLKNNLKIFE